MVQTYAICTKYHATKKCPSLPGLKAIFKEVEAEIEPVYLLNQCREWQAQQAGMPTNPSSFFQLSKYNSQQYTGATWQNQPPFPNWS